MLASTDLKGRISKKKLKKQLPGLEERIYCLQKASWDAGLPVIVLIEGWKTINKNGLIRSLTGPLDPRGFVYHAIRAPQPYEQARPWMWRFWLKIPERGQWAIFDQSWYRRIFSERPQEKINAQEKRRALRDINHFESTLSDDGILILKFFLHTSKNAYKTNAGASTGSSASSSDTDGRIISHRYDRLLGVYEDVIHQSEQVWAHWNVVPADDQPTARLDFLKTIIHSLQHRLGIECEPKRKTDKSNLPGTKRKRARTIQAPPTPDEKPQATEASSPAEETGTPIAESAVEDSLPFSPEQGKPDEAGPIEAGSPLSIEQAGGSSNSSESELV